MAANNIMRVKDIDVSEITMSTPKSLDNGGKMIALYHKGKPLIIQIPMMEAPYGLSRFPSDKGGDDKISLDLSFKGIDSNPNMRDFYDLMKNIDSKMIEEGFKNGMPWFKKKFPTQDVLDALYTHVVKHYKDKETGEITDKYPPTVKLALPTRDGKYTCEVYDASRQKVELDGMDLKRAQVTAIIQCTGIWIAGGKFGCKFKAIQMKVSNTASKISGYAFLEDDDRLVNM